MKKKTRYHVKDPLVDKKHGILKNKFKITDKEKLQLIETDHLAEAYRKAVSEYGADHTFTEVEKYHDAIRRVWHLADYSGLTDLFRPLLEKQA